MSEKELMSDIRNCVNAWIDRKGYLEALQKLIHLEPVNDEIDIMRFNLAVELIAGLLEEIDMGDIADAFREVMG